MMFMKVAPVSLAIIGRCGQLMAMRKRANSARAVPSVTTISYGRCAVERGVDLSMRLMMNSSPLQRNNFV